MNSASPDQLMTVAEAAALLRVGQRTIYRWADEEKIPVVRLAGTTLRIRHSSLVSWMEASEAGAPPEPEAATALPRARTPDRTLGPKSWVKPRATGRGPKGGEQ